MAEYLNKKIDYDIRVIRIKIRSKEEFDKYSNKNIYLKDILNINKINYKNNYINLKKVVKLLFIYCFSCNKYKSGVVHHLNRNRKDNSLENLMILCAKCHYKKHKQINKERIKLKNRNI